MKLELVGLEAIHRAHAGGAVGRHAEARRHRAGDGARPVDPVPGRAFVGLDPITAASLDATIRGCRRTSASRSSS
jgi:hypothetical protein